MWLPWQYALWLAVAFAVATFALYLRRPADRWLWIRELTRESAIFATLYTVWQGIGQLSTGEGLHTAVARGAAIARTEHLLHFPSEEWTQRIVLHSHLLIRGANWYYVVGHTPVLAVFLIWMYLRHRADFARWRTALAAGCIIGELIQIVPVAPPRMALHGVIDTGQVYGPTVYESSGAGFAPQLAAMPSLHCVWAVTVGAAVFLLARGPWRWLGPVHAVITVLVVTITGNHYWLDAVAGAGLVLLGLVLHDGVSYARRRWVRPRPTRVSQVPLAGATGQPEEPAGVAYARQGGGAT